MGLRVGIDATNLRRGGGITHLVEVLSVAEPSKSGIDQILVWGGSLTLERLPCRSWLTKICPESLNKGLLIRTIWQRFQLSGAVRESACDVLFVPGGSYAGNFQPVVTMSRNLLPFEFRELLRYGVSLTFLKLLLLRFIQTRTYRNAEGVIFLTHYAKRTVEMVIGEMSGTSTIIPHGLSPRFQAQPKPQRSIHEYTMNDPYRLVYVSIVDHYKHQCKVVEAVSTLRSEGIPIVLDLVGPAYDPALVRLNNIIQLLDPCMEWAFYHGAIPYQDLHQLYAKADLGIFASSCENMPNILLETMAAGLPIACSTLGPMPEILGDDGVYFDPEYPSDIATALRRLINSQALRKERALDSFNRSMQYSWTRCADDTLLFISNVAQING